MSNSGTPALKNAVLQGFGPKKRKNRLPNNQFWNRLIDKILLVKYCTKSFFKTSDFDETGSACPAQVCF
jgi:hypothetical protein